MRDLASQHVEQSELSPGYRRRAEVHAPDWDFRADDWRAELGRVIEAEILPRLLLAHERERGASEHRRGFATRTAAGAPEPDLDVAEFTERLLGGDDGLGLELHRRDREPGSAAPRNHRRRRSRRRRGVWARCGKPTTCDFIEVTVGLRRLAQAAGTLTRGGRSARAGDQSAPRSCCCRAGRKPCVRRRHGRETFFRARGLARRARQRRTVRGFCGTNGSTPSAFRSAASDSSTPCVGDGEARSRRLAQSRLARARRRLDLRRGTRTCPRESARTPRRRTSRQLSIWPRVCYGGAPSCKLSHTKAVALPWSETEIGLRDRSAEFTRRRLARFCARRSKACGAIDAQTAAR